MTDYSNNSSTKWLQKALLMLVLMSSAVVMAETPKSVVPVQQDQWGDSGAQQKDADAQESKVFKLSAEDAETGKTYNVEINSENLKYNSDTGLYEANGSAYLIIPEKNMELLADKITFDTKTQTMLATGKVYLVKDGNVVSTTRAVLDSSKEYSYYEKPRTMTDTFRMAAQSAQRFEDLTVIKNGRFLVDKEQMRALSRKMSQNRFGYGNGAIYNYYSASWGRKFLINSNAGILNNYAMFDSVGGPDEKKSEDGALPEITSKAISPQDVDAADYSDISQGNLRIKVHRADITKGENGMDEIVFKRSTFKVGKLPVFFMPTAEFGYDEKTKYTAYLGPEFGYDLDQGGYHFGPGFDRQVGRGWLKFVPFVSYGKGRRFSDSVANPELLSAQPGVGAQLSYLSKATRFVGSYNTTLAAPRLFLEQRLFGRFGTRLRAGYNQSVRPCLYPFQLREITFQP